MTPLLMLALTAAAPVPPPPAAPPKKEAKLDGIWRATAVERPGAKQPPPGFAGVPADTYTLVIAGGEYAFRTHAGALKVDAEKKTLDMVVTDGRYKGETNPGLFERDGDTLRLAIPLTPRAGNERPKEVKADENARHYPFTFERDAKATPEEVAARLKAMRAAVPAGFGPVAPAADRTTQDMLKQVLEKLDRIEKRLDELEKKK